MPAARDAHKAKPRQATGERPFFCTADVRKERIERAAFFGSPAHLGASGFHRLAGGPQSRVTDYLGPRRRD